MELVNCGIAGVARCGIPAFAALGVLVATGGDRTLTDAATRGDARRQAATRAANEGSMIFAIRWASDSHAIWHAVSLADCATGDAATGSAM